MGRSFRTLGDILGDVRDARAWYVSIGIPTTGTRLELIEKRVLQLVDELTEMSPATVVERWGNVDTYYVLSDGVGFGRIARETRKLGPNLLPKRTLRSILEGPLSPLDEKPGDASVNARNFFTELELAADLSERGVPPIGFDDLRFRFRGVEYAVQCKRLLSHSRVRENIEHAYRQLTSTLQTEQERGFIAIAIEKVMGLEGKILKVADDAELTSEIHRQIEAFRTSFGHTWRFIDLRVIGIIIILRFLCYTLKHDVVAPVYHVAFACPQTSDLQRIQDLVSHLEASNQIMPPVR